jgi:hypothetical protein
MKKLFTTLAIVATTVCFAQTKQARNVGSFSAISAATGVTVEVTQGTEESVFIIVSDDEYAENLKTVVENGMLKIYYENTKGKDKKMQKITLKAFVTYKNIEKIRAGSGASVVAINAVSVAALGIDISSGSKFNGEVKVKDLSLEQSSGSNLKISGSAINVKVNIGSGSVCTASNLLTETCNVIASSGASVNIAVSKMLTANVSSGASVNYKGEPVVQKKVSSGGSVKKI